ncbi:MAG: HD domain-containing protein [Saprospiraceae bacterium]|nr:HD domain-containing protein [Saprospiraceae bacterium]
MCGDTTYGLSSNAIVCRRPLKTRLSPLSSITIALSIRLMLNAALELAHDEHVTGDDLMLLKTAALLHDCGFVNAYHNHEEEGVKIAQSILPTFGYSAGQIETICAMILKTKFHARPETLLGKNTFAMQTSII